jgi:hypothetical protein
MSRRRLAIISVSKPGSANVAHRIPWALISFRGVESMRAVPPVMSVSTVLEVVAVPENVTEAGRKLQEVFCGSPEQENCRAPE